MSSTPFSFLLWDPYNASVTTLNVVPQTSFLFIYLFFGFIFSDFQYSSVISSSSLILFSGSSNLQFPSDVFYISVIVFSSLFGSLCFLTLC